MLKISRALVRMAAFLLAAAMMFLSVSCSAVGSSRTWSVKFGPRFMKIAQTTPEEWCEYLKENGPDFLGEIKITGKGPWKSVSLVDYDGRAKWVYFAKQKLEELRKEFPSVPEQFAMRLGEDYDSLHFYFDHSVSSQVDEDFIRQAKTWCTFMQIAYGHRSLHEQGLFFPKRYP